jgi:hypothetical protein
MKKIFIVTLSIIFSQFTYADSPLTSTDFYKAYLDVPMVLEAMHSNGQVTNGMMEFMIDDTNSLDVKLAIINAIGWQNKGLLLSEMYLIKVINKKKYVSEFESDYMAFRWNATRDELLCFTYMKAMDNYFDVTEAFEIANETLRKYPDSFAANMIYNLIKAQGLVAFNEYCYAAKIFKVFKNNTSLHMDMRKEALSYITGYMDRLGMDCTNNPDY